MKSNTTERARERDRRWYKERKSLIRGKYRRTLRGKAEEDKISSKHHEDRSRKRDNIY